jgi:hypothetical protein
MQASCLCGKVKFSFEKFNGAIAHCHCTMCRKFTGAAYGTFGTVDANDIQWESGQDKITVYPSSEIAERGFCNCCGSSIYYRLRKPDAPYEIALGILESEPEQPVNANIFCAYRAQWPLGAEALPCFDESRI